jgi:hypothetical protein
VIPCALIPIALSKNGTNGPAQRWTIDEHERNDLLVNKKNIRPFKTVTVVYAESSVPLASSSSPSPSSSSSSSFSSSSSSSSSSASSTSSLPTISSSPSPPSSSTSSSSSSSASSGDYSWNDIDGIIEVEEAYDEEYLQPTILQTQARDEEESRQSYMATLDESILKRLRKSPSSVKGDHLHCFKNLGDSMKKKNGAHATFMRGLSDSFFMVSKTDIECVEQAMRAQGMNNSEIANKKKFFWKQKFLRHCRRTTGMPFFCVFIPFFSVSCFLIVFFLFLHELHFIMQHDSGLTHIWLSNHLLHYSGHDRVNQLSRFDKFIDTFTLIKDAKTKELLITPKTKLKIAATRLAIASGYYIDPPGVNMFRELGRDELGRMKYACYRGTNGLEVIIEIGKVYIL